MVATVVDETLVRSGDGFQGQNEAVSDGREVVLMTLKNSDRGYKGK